VTDPLRGKLIMEVKDFERYLELVKIKEAYYSNPRSGDKEVNK